MIVENLFNDVLLVKENIYEDSRGYFSEIYNKNNLINAGIKNNFIQDNISYSSIKGTIRGLHFQKNPLSQGKFLRVLNGSIEDFFIDLRKSSSTYEKFSSLKMNYASGSIYIPEGFAHGFCTLEANTIVMYKVDEYYSEEHEAGIIWNDSFFNIKWPIKGNKPILSEKDKKLPNWEDIKGELEF
tara:strand:+ start:1505 stop:2056 length:552 start_codon:yes stop_codon:yes gene_type:complete